MSENPSTATPALPKSDQNLVWLDCEMTGLDPETERLLEIAVVVTGPNLEPRVEGPVFVIHQTDALLDLMDACCEGIRLAADYAEKGSVLAVSDAGCAALFCKAALQASALNVAINTKLMTDRTHAAALDEKAARMLAEYLPLADEVYQSVASRLRA